MYLLLFFPLLFWISGLSAAKEDITGPKTVRGQERSSLTVQCRYNLKWKYFRKWWCRGADWSSCKILIITDGSEKEVKKERLSIRDYQKELMFSVTLEDLKREDAGSYWYSITNLSILLPLIFAVLLLLLVAASLLAWRMVRQQKKAAALSSEQPMESDLCYANLSLRQSGTSPGSSRQKASTKSSSAQADQGKVEYVTMAPFWREEISYASVCVDILNQEPTYSNTGHTPSRGCEDSTEYTSIRRP
ncbi:CMRF35-like molecule 1 [Erethizon dorsatum]